jgi:hypothetical protein
MGLSMLVAQFLAGLAVKRLRQKESNVYVKSSLRHTCQYDRETPLGKALGRAGSNVYATYSRIRTPWGHRFQSSTELPIPSNKQPSPGWMLSGAAKVQRNDPSSNQVTDSCAWLDLTVI